MSKAYAIERISAIFRTMTAARAAMMLSSTTNADAVVSQRLHRCLEIPGWHRPLELGRRLLPRTVKTATRRKCPHVAGELQMCAQESHDVPLHPAMDRHLIEP